MSPTLKVRVSSAWVSTDAAGAARVDGTTVPFGPSGGPTYEQLSWPAEPSDTDEMDGDQAYNMGIRFHVTEPLACPGVSWRVPDTVSDPPGGVHMVSLWRVVGELLLASASFTPTPGGYQQVLFSAPVDLETGQNYVAAVHTRHYVYRPSGGTYPSTPSGRIVSDEGRLTGADTGTLAYPATATGLMFYVSPLAEVS